MDYGQLAISEGEDVFAISKRSLIVVLFGTAKSQNFDTAISLAKSALNYRTLSVGKDTVHVAAFAKNAREAAGARALIAMAENWSSTQLFACGRQLKGGFEVTATLNCYKDALACNETDAHCVILRRGIFDAYEYSHLSRSLSDEKEIQRMERDYGRRFMLPCALAHSSCRVEKDHPASWANQLQQIAVRKNTDWCPLFDLEKFRQCE